MKHENTLSPISDSTLNHFRSAIRRSLLRRHSLTFLLRSSHVKRMIRRNEKRRLENQEKYATPIPPTCIFSVTWKCNLSCTGCYAMNYDHTNMLSPDEVERCIREMMELGTSVFVIVGGEPLMIRDIIHRLGKMKNAFFLLFTNATLLNEEKIRSLKEYPHILPVVSLDGDPGQNDERRGEGVIGKVNRALDLFKKYRIPFGFSTVVNHTNLPLVTSKGWLRGMRKNGALAGFLIDYIPFAKDEKMVLSHEDNTAKDTALAERRRDTGLFLLNFPSDEYKSVGCRSAGLGFIHINANGNVEPCPFSHYAADNVREKSMLEILNSEFFTQLRSKFGNQTDNSHACLLYTEIDQVNSIARECRAFATDYGEALSF